MPLGAMRGKDRCVCMMMHGDRRRGKDGWIRGDHEDGGLGVDESAAGTIIV